MDPDRFEQVEIASRQALWDWLEKHHTQKASVWLVTFKAAERDRYVSRDAVLDALVAYGWIDGRRMKLDDLRSMQLISPRKQQVWAQTYKTRADRLRASGRMTQAGEAAIKRSKALGLWDKLDHVDALCVPEDLAVALARARATRWWNKVAPSYRRNVLRWIAQAKQNATRARRIATVADHAARGERVPQY